MAVVPRPNPAVQPVTKAANLTTPNPHTGHLQPPVRKDSAPKIMKYKQSAGHKGSALTGTSRFADHNRQSELVSMNRMQDTLPVPDQIGNQRIPSALVTKPVETSASSSHSTVASTRMQQ
jgi:hypothetical protein